MHRDMISTPANWLFLQHIHIFSLMENFMYYYNLHHSQEKQINKKGEGGSTELSYSQNDTLAVWRHLLAILQA
jgi:hypothetical protein